MWATRYWIPWAYLKGHWAPIKFSKNPPKLFHLLFADDIILFSKATKHSTAHIFKILIYFSNISRQKINLNKFKIFFSPSTPIIIKKIYYFYYIIRKLS